MHDPLFMCGLERVDDLPRDWQRLIERQARAVLPQPGESLRQRRSFDDLENERADAGRLLEPEDGADVRWLSRGEQRARAGSRRRAPDPLRRRWEDLMATSRPSRES